MPKAIKLKQANDLTNILLLYDNLIYEFAMMMVTNMFVIANILKY